MKRVYQSVINNTEGDCVSACIASLLELPLSKVPNFARIGVKTDRDMMDLAREWLGKNYNLSLVTIYMGKGVDTGEDIRVNGALAGTPCIGVLPSQVFPDTLHAVVGEIDAYGTNFVVIHDPNPNNAPYGNVYPTFVDFLVPLNPEVFGY